MTEKQDILQEDQTSPIYEFAKPFFYNGEKVDQIDISIVADVTRKQLNQAINRYMLRKEKTGSVYVQDLECMLDIYCLCAGKPFDYFEELSGKDYAKLPFLIMNFLAS